MTTPQDDWPQLIVEAGFTAAAPAVQPGNLILDDPVNGLLDTGTLADDTAWTDLSGGQGLLQSLTVTRASTREQGPVITYEGGTLAAVLENSDARFSPDNLSGPYVTPGVPGISFGAYLDGASLGTAGWTASAAAWQAITGIPLSAGRWFAGTTWTIGTTLSQMIAAGVKVILDLTPAYNPPSAADYAAIRSFMQALQAAGAAVEVSLWHEPTYGPGMSAAQYTAMMAFYAGAIRPYYRLWSCFSGPDALESNGFYAGDAVTDGIAVDCYGTSSADLDNAQAMADGHGKPLALWEFGVAFDLGISPSPVTGKTQADQQAFLSYVQGLFTRRITAGKPVGDILFFSATGASTGTSNFLGPWNSQDGGFYGGKGNWAAGGNCTAAYSTAQSHSGIGSLAMTASANGNMSATMCPTTLAGLTAHAKAVSPGDVVAASVWFQGAAGRRVHAVTGLYDAAGGVVAPMFPQESFTTDAAAWGSGFAWAYATVPAGGAWFIVKAQVDSALAGEVHYAGDPQLAVLPATTDHTAPIQYPPQVDWRIAYLAGMQAALNGKGAIPAVTSVRPMIPVRARAAWAGVTYPLWHGFAQSWDPVDDEARDYATVTLTCADGFLVLAGATVGIVGVTGELPGARAARILAAAGWYDAARGQSALSPGSSPLQVPAQGGAALDLLKQVAASEIGALYCDEQGRITFRGRHDVLTDPRSATVQAVFGDRPGTVQAAGTELYYSKVTRPAADLTIANDIQATSAGGTMQEVTDAASVARYLFRRTWNPPELLLTSDPETLQWAQYVAWITAAGTPEFDELTLIPAADPDNLWPQALGRQAGDRIQVWRRPPGMPAPVVRDCLIRGITHEVTADGWITTWQLQDASRYSFFVLDDPILGRLDANALAFLRDGCAGASSPATRPWRWPRPGSESWM